MADKTKRVHIRVDDELYKRVTERAGKLGISVNEFVLRGIQWYLNCVKYGIFLK